MNLYKQKRDYYRAHLLLVLVILFIAACGRSGQSSEEISKVTPIPSGESAVAYEASSDEAEDATQADTDQTLSANQEPSVNESPIENSQVPENSQATSHLAVSTLPSTEDTADTADAADIEADTEAEIGVPFTVDNVVYREIRWDGLIPVGFTAESIMSKYQEELDSLESGSPEMSELYSKMQDEFNNAPANEALNEVEVRIPGFVTPLDYTDGVITEFLLVPTLGACIHVPPPPVNQTVLVKTAEGQGIPIEDSYDPVWVMGKIATESTTTELASAGYNIEEAIIESYESSE